MSPKPAERSAAAMDSATASDTAFESEGFGDSAPVPFIVSPSLTN